MNTNSNKQKLILDKETTEAVNEKLIASIPEIDLQSEFLAWERDHTLINKFKASKIKILKGEQDKVVIQPFFAYPKEKGALLSNTANSDAMFNNACDLTLLQQSKLESLPFVKIIASTSDNYKPGEIYTVKPDLAIIDNNPAYADWYMRRASQPSMEGREPVPPSKVMGWDAWGNFRFKIDYFDKNITFDSFHIYLIPAMFLLTQRLK